MNINSSALVLASAMLLGGCAANAAAAPASSPAATVPSAADRKALGAVLAQYDRQIAALRATLRTPAFANTNGDIASATTALRRSIAQSSTQVQTLIADKAAAYAAREDDAVSAVLAQANAPAPSTQQVRERLERDYRSEYAQLRSGAQRDMNGYQRAALDQQQHAYTAFVAAVQLRTQQAYEHRASELRENESALLLDLARQDSGTRLQLRAKLTTLAMSGSQRARIVAQLAAIQSREDRSVAALRERDARILNAYRDGLVAQANLQIATMSAQIQTRTQANLAKRRDVLAAQQAAAASLPLGSASPAPAAHDDLRARITALRAQGAQAFRADAQATIDAFGSARDDIAARFAEIRSTNTSGDRSTLSAIAQLEADRAAVAARLSKR